MGLYFGTGGAKDEMLGVDWERGHTPNSNTQCHSGREVNPRPYKCRLLRLITIAGLDLLHRQLGLLLDLRGHGLYVAYVGGD